MCDSDPASIGSEGGCECIGAPIGGPFGPIWWSSGIGRNGGKRIGIWNFWNLESIKKQVKAHRSWKRIRESRWHDHHRSVWWTDRVDLVHGRIQRVNRHAKRMLKNDEILLTLTVGIPVLFVHPNLSTNQKLGSYNTRETETNRPQCVNAELVRRDSRNFGHGNSFLRMLPEYLHTAFAVLSRNNALLFNWHREQTELREQFELR